VDTIKIVVNFFLFLQVLLKILLWLALYTRELHFCNVGRFWSVYVF